MSISLRKNDHISVNLHEDVQSDIRNGFEAYRLIHNALPECDFSTFSIETDFLGKKLSAPFLISSMTGGTDSGETINCRLLKAAAALNIAFAMGSQRIYLEGQNEEQLARPRVSPRAIAPDIPILANIGAIQLNHGFTREHCLRAVEQVDADALILHLNPLQEVFQADGDTDFNGLLEKIEMLCRNFPIPLIAKEVGWGIDAENARRLYDAGVSMIDVAGAGGTSWVKVESAIIGTDEVRALAEPFFGWGLPTAACIAEVHAAFPEIPLIASGGITNGVEAAKAVRLGARLFGMAGALLPAAAEGTDQELMSLLQRVIQQYKIACFVSKGIEKIGA